MIVGAVHDSGKLPVILLSSLKRRQERALRNFVDVSARCASRGEEFVCQFLYAQAARWSGPHHVDVRPARARYEACLVFVGQQCIRYGTKSFCRDPHVPKFGLVSLVVSDLHDIRRRFIPVITRLRSRREKRERYAAVVSNAEVFSGADVCCFSCSPRAT